MARSGFVRQAAIRLDQGRLEAPGVPRSPAENRCPSEQPGRWRGRKLQTRKV